MKISHENKGNVWKKMRHFAKWSEFCKRKQLWNDSLKKWHLKKHLYKELWGIMVSDCLKNYNPKKWKQWILWKTMWGKQNQDDHEKVTDGNRMRPFPFSSAELNMSRLSRNFQCTNELCSNKKEKICESKRVKNQVWSSHGQDFSVYEHWNHHRQSNMYTQSPDAKHLEKWRVCGVTT